MKADRRKNCSTLLLFPLHSRFLNATFITLFSEVGEPSTKIPLYIFSTDASSNVTFLKMVLEYRYRGTFLKVFGIFGFLLSLIVFVIIFVITFCYHFCY